MKTKFKKITLPVFVGMASFYISAFFLLGVITGYIFMRFFTGKIKSIEFSLGSYEIHLHHWFYSSLALAILFISGVYQLFPIFLLGFGGGVVFEGIYRYNDWYKILSRKQN